MRATDAASPGTAARITASSLPCTRVTGGPLASARTRQSVPQHRQEMTGAAAEHEEMPDRVAVSRPLPDIEQHAAGVEQAAGEQPAEAGRRKRRGERADDEDGEPAHAEVEQGGEAREAEASERLEHDPDAGQGPQKGQEEPPQPSAKHPEGEGRLGAGAEAVDR